MTYLLRLPKCLVLNHLLMSVRASGSHVIVEPLIKTRNNVPPTISAIRNNALAADKTEDVLIDGMKYAQIRLRKLLDSGKKQIRKPV